MTNKMLKYAVIMPLVAALSACGGGGVDGGGSGGSGNDGSDSGSEEASVEDSYQSLSATSGVLQLGGVSLNIDENAGSVQESVSLSSDLSGTFNAETVILTLKDENSGLDIENAEATSPNDNTTQWSNNDQTQIVTTAGPDFEYVTYYEYEIFGPGENAPSIGTGVGYGGNVTKVSDMPISGTANYTGEIDGLYIDSNVNGDSAGFTSNDVVVTADFGRSKVDVVANNVVRREDSDPAFTAFDALTISGMDINGNQFSGGTFSTTQGGESVTLTGANTQTEAIGAFFGYEDDISAPAEVAVIASSVGDDGVIFAGVTAATSDDN